LGGYFDRIGYGVSGSGFAAITCLSAHNNKGRLQKG